MGPRDPTYLGEVLSVTGGTINVRMTASLASGLAIIKGRTYSVGQVGSFVRIPQGYQDLYGIVTEIGAKTASDILDGIAVGERWMRVELIGEAVADQFERGISRHPNVRDPVHIVTETDLRRIYGRDGIEQVDIGTLAASENIRVKISLDHLVTRHSAIVGSTGSGKSTAVAGFLRALLSPSHGQGAPGARILLLDIHGEYASAMGDIARIFSATPQIGESSLYLPYWALEAGELLELIGGPMGEAHEIAFGDKIFELKHAAATHKPFPGVELDSLTVDSPIPFSLKKLWYDLIDFETKTFTGPQRDIPQLEARGDPEKLTPPRYTPHAMGSAGPFLNTNARGIRRQLNMLRSRLLDRRFDFILRPGPWEPDLDGRVEKDLDSLLEGWLGNDKPLTIMDLSGVPSVALERLVGSLLRIIFEALFWGRDKTEGGVLRPILIVMEEAHRYVNASQGGDAAEMAKRIAKEGRKYGIGMMIVSQRPSEIDETILSQCGTLIALRLSNPADRGRVQGALPDNLAGLVDLLPVLRTGEALIVGEAARLPTRCRIAAPEPEHRPRSADPEVARSWSRKRVAEGYDRVVASWRAQRTTAVAVERDIKRVEVSDTASDDEAQR